jgi:putative transposase
LTTWIAQHYGFVAVEALNVAGMLKNHKLSLSLSDAAMATMLTLLEQKVTIDNGQLVKIDRFFPSSKTCSQCGHKHADLTLSDRIFVCFQCSFTLDRDWNAALTILHEGPRGASNACRPIGSRSTCDLF